MQIGLPLLTKELIEQSTRKRTYVVRFLFAIALYGITLSLFQNQIGSWNASGYHILGKGRILFQSLAWLEFGAIYLFLPAMTCSVLTAEKERDTLALLLVTKLGPWTIIVEKLFSRLIPMATFGLLSMPLLAIAYSIGGVESDDIAKLIWLLTITAFQVGTFAVLCSAWFRTTGSAFLAAYLLGALAIMASGLFFEFGCHFWIRTFFADKLSNAMNEWLFQFNCPHVALLAFGPSILNGAEITSGLNIGISATGRQSILDCVLMAAPMFGMSLVNLALARFVLWRRAFVRPKSFMLQFFQTLDRLFQRVNNNRITRGVEFFRGSAFLPTEEPISWRETSKRPLGTVRYLIRILLILEVPLLFLIVGICGAPGRGDAFLYFRIFETCLWCTATLVLVIQSTGLIANERSRQTLDVLLTTPLSGNEIVRQKFAGVHRMIGILWVPFTTLYTFKIWRESWGDVPLGYQGVAEQTIFDTVRYSLAVAIYLPTIAWFGFRLGLRSRSQTHAVLLAMTIVAAVCVVPMTITSYLPSSTNPILFSTSTPDDVILGFSPLLAINWASPVTALTGIMNHPTTWFFMSLHFVAMMVVYYSLVYSSTNAFSYYAGRNAGIENLGYDHRTEVTYNADRCDLPSGIQNYSHPENEI